LFETARAGRSDPPEIADLLSLALTIDFPICPLALPDCQFTGIARWQPLFHLLFSGNQRLRATAPGVRWRF
jgi:hypothetical protein